MAHLVTGNPYKVRSVLCFSNGNKNETTDHVSIRDQYGPRAVIGVEQMNWPPYDYDVTGYTTVPIEMGFDPVTGEPRYELKLKPNSRGRHARDNSKIKLRFSVSSITSDKTVDLLAWIGNDGVDGYDQWWRWCTDNAVIDIVDGTTCFDEYKVGTGSPQQPPEKLTYSPDHITSTDAVNIRLTYKSGSDSCLTTKLEGPGKVTLKRDNSRASQDRKASDHLKHKSRSKGSPLLARRREYLSEMNMYQDMLPESLHCVVPMMTDQERKTLKAVCDKIVGPDVSGRILFGQAVVTVLWGVKYNIIGIRGNVIRCLRKAGDRDAMGEDAYAEWFSKQDYRCDDMKKHMGNARASGYITLRESHDQQAEEASIPEEEEEEEPVVATIKFVPVFPPEVIVAAAGRPVSPIVIRSLDSEDDDEEVVPMAVSAVVAAPLAPRVGFEPHDDELPTYEEAMAATMVPVDSGSEGEEEEMFDDTVVSAEEDDEDIFAEEIIPEPVSHETAEDEYHLADDPLSIHFNSNGKTTIKQAIWVKTACENNFAENGYLYISGNPPTVNPFRHRADPYMAKTVRDLQTNRVIIYRKFWVGITTTKPDEVVMATPYFVGGLPLRGPEIDLRAGGCFKNSHISVSFG